MQNRLIKLLIIISVFIIAIGSLNQCFAGLFSRSSKDTDRINQYYITVNPRKDASLDIRYDVQWEILSDDIDALDEVLIGIPNSNVNQLKPLTSNISSIKENNSVVKLGFRNPYKGKQVVSFSFSIHQMNMYTMENGKCNFNFTPGWFDNIEVKDIKILWNSKNVQNADANDFNSDGYYVWSGSLKKGKKMTANIDYLENNFKISTKQNNSETALGELASAIDTTNVDGTTDYNDIMNGVDLQAFNMEGYANMDPNTALKNIYKIGGLAVGCLTFGTVLSMFAGLGRGYTSHGGYGYYGRPSRSSYTSSSSSFGSFLGGSSGGFGGGSHSCACACACAGGGRAGCSKKDFYGTNVKTSNVGKALKLENI